MYPPATLNAIARARSRTPDERTWNDKLLLFLAVNGGVATTYQLYRFYGEFRTRLCEMRKSGIAITHAERVAGRPKNNNYRLMDESEADNAA